MKRRRLFFIRTRTTSRIPGKGGCGGPGGEEGEINKKKNKEMCWRFFLENLVHSLSVDSRQCDKLHLEWLPTIFLLPGLLLFFGVVGIRHLVLLLLLFRLQLT